LERVRVAGVPIPGWIFGKVSRQALPLDPIPSFPVRLDIHSVVLENNLLKIL
jgi:hypothetical protein